MAYAPTEWSNGDVITAEKLNHMESGVESGNAVNFFAINVTYAEDESIIADKTYAEIDAMIENYPFPVILVNNVVCTLLNHTTLFSFTYPVMTISGGELYCSISTFNVNANDEWTYEEHNYKLTATNLT